MNAIDEWLDSEGAKRDALKFKNGCYIISGRRCGKTAFALSQIEQYLKDHPDAKIAIPYYHNGHYYHKKLINSVYGYKKPPYDDIPHDAVRYAVEEFERKQREERLEKAKLTNEELKRMLNNSHYGVCWPSELIESCERIDKYRKEVEEMYKTLICSDVEFTADLFLTGRMPDYDKKISAKIYAYDDCSGFDIRFKFFAGQEWCFVVHFDDDMDVKAAYYAGTALFNFIYNRICYQTNGQVTINNTAKNLSYIRHIIEEYDLFKDRKAKENTKKETTEMKGYKFMVPKGVFGSRVYIQDKNSDAITYAGTLTDMHLETASGCEMHGNIDFIADDEPIERFANLNRGFIKNVVFHDPATIVEWADGSKTVVQVRDGEKFDPEKGLAMAIAKKAMGNKRDYYHIFKHYLKKVKTESVCGEKVKTITLPEELAYDVMQFLKEKAGEKEGK